MKQFAIGLICCVFVAGCTLPSQRVADQEMSLGTRQADAVYRDMGRLARQSILDKAAADAAVAATAGSSEDARAVVQSLFDTMNHIAWLDVQWERARAVLRDAHGYIMEQQGILSLYAAEWKEAKKKMEKGESE